MQDDAILSIRAIASAMARQFLTPFLIGGGVVLVIFFLLVVILSMQYSGWWLVLLIPLLPLMLIFIVAFTILWLILNRISPSMSKTQRKAVRQFTDRVSAYSDLAGTPRFLIAFRVVRDVLRKRPRKYLGELLSSSSELKRDFEAVRESFINKT